MSRFDVKDKRLAQWLSGTNWPEDFSYEHTIEMKTFNGSPKVLNKVSIFKSINKLEYYINSKVLTRSDFDELVKKSIDAINKDFEALSRQSTLMQKVERTEQETKDLQEIWEKS